MKLIHTGLALAVLAILPGAADAGLMNGYQASGSVSPVQCDPSPGAADAGLMYAWQVSGSVTPVPGSPSPGQIDITTASGIASGNGSNFETTIGTVSLSNWSTAMPNASGSNPLTEFSVLVTITDSASGQTGQVTVYGEAFSNWKQQPNGSWAFSLAGIGVTTPGSLTLGTNLYRVGIEQVFSSPNSTAPIVANVEVSVTSLAAPEPTTLALAACGFPIVGFFFQRRRANASGR